MTQPWEWHLHLNEDERREFFRDLREAAAQAEVSGDIEPVWKCLREWRETAEILASMEAEHAAADRVPAARDDFTEAQQPRHGDGEMARGAEEVPQ